MKYLTWFEMLDLVSFNRTKTLLSFFYKYNQKDSYDDDDLWEFMEYYRNHPVAIFVRLGQPFNWLYFKVAVIKQTIAFLVWYVVANLALKFFSTLPFYIYRFIDDESIDLLANYVACGYIQHSHRLNRLQSVIAWVRRSFKWGDN